MSRALYSAIAIALIGVGGTILFFVGLGQLMAL